MGYLSIIILSAVVGVSLATSGCYNIDTIDRSLRDAYCDQPLFVTFLAKTSEAELLDNICYTYFPLPDDPDTFQIYISRVFCDGSNDITSFIGTQIELGVSRQAKSSIRQSYLKKQTIIKVAINVKNPFCTFTESVFGYAGCDTYLIYRCFNYGDCSSVGKCNGVAVSGFSASCRPIGLSCLRKVEEIVKDNCLPEQDYYVLPMKLPNRCVTQQLCLQPPNPFYGAFAEPVAVSPAGPLPFVGLI